MTNAPAATVVVGSTADRARDTTDQAACCHRYKKKSAPDKPQSLPADLKLLTNPTRGLSELSDTSQWHVIKSTSMRYNPIEDYKMSANPRGFCLIVNNVTFDLDVFPKRKGSDMDAYRFKEIFKQLGFSVESKRNLTADKMKAAFKVVSARCSSKHDALVVIILSHGSESGIYGTDGLEVDLNDILSYFDNKKCKYMLGKPKVFIVQACRGRQADYGVRETQTFISQPETQGFTQPSQLSQLNRDAIRISRWSEIDRNNHPTRTDMVLCFSCHSGFVSTRNEDEGSWLGASLAEHLQSQASRRHLIEIFNMVSRDVRRRESVSGHKQVLEITTIGFDRNLYFNPGLSDQQQPPPSPQLLLLQRRRPTSRESPSKAGE